MGLSYTPYIIGLSYLQGSPNIMGLSYVQGFPNIKGGTISTFGMEEIIRFAVTTNTGENTYRS